AHSLEPDSPRFGFVYGVALESIESRAAAIKVWEGVAARHPNDRQTLQSLVIALAESGEPGRALPFAERLSTLAPEDRDIAALIGALRTESARRHGP
ncbi:MAG: hypothetical protein K8E66_08250, partial [Phycisphaerales bacterium]|nr:hypothetical protein [Phycisphaerales bacterium]